MESLDIKRNTKGRRQLSGLYWHWETKAWGANRIWDPSSPCCKRWVFIFRYQYLEI